MNEEMHFFDDVTERLKYNQSACNGSPAYDIPITSLGALPCNGEPVRFHLFTKLTSILFYIYVYQQV